jgi:hypothetical protein
MPGHPNLPESDAKQIVTWIMSLADNTPKQKSLPVAGSVKPTLDKKPADNGVLVLTASYTDKGGAGIKPLTGSTMVALRNSRMALTGAKDLKGYSTMSYNGRHLLLAPKDAGSFAMDSIDLTDVAAIEIALGGQKAPQFGYAFELRLDSPDGRKIGEGSLAGGSKNVNPQGFFGGAVTAKIEPVTDGRLHKLYIVSRPLNPQEDATVALNSVEFKAK